MSNFNKPNTIDIFTSSQLTLALPQHSLLNSLRNDAAENSERQLT